MTVSGDFNSDATYLGVGRIISAWESIEFSLCIIFSAFAGDPGGEAMRLYGAKRSFPHRLNDFGDMAENQFVKHPNQKREGELLRHLTGVAGFMERRNEVAHDNISLFRERLLGEKSGASSLR